MLTYVHVRSLGLDVKNYYNNTVDVGLFTFKNVIQPFVNSIVTTKINKPFKDGPIDIGPALESKGLGALNLRQLQIWISY